MIRYNTNTKLDTLNHFQRAILARALFSKTGAALPLDPKKTTTRLMLERIVEEMQ